MQNLPNLNRLSNHEFILKVLNDSVPLMRHSFEVTDYERGTKERYIAEVGYCVGQVLNQIERIDQAGILVNSYPRIKAWNARYGRFEYFQYHLEQYFIAIAGLVDRLLLLINQLYELGINEEDVRYTNVTNELQKQGHEDILASMRALQKSLNGIKKSKNNYTHSVRFWEKELWQIGLYEFSLKNNITPDPKGYLKEDLKFDLKLYRMRKMDAILKNELALHNILSSIYDMFNKSYQSRLG